MKREDLIARLERMRPRLVHDGVSHLAMFGSRARGDNSPSSDIDLLLDVDPAAHFTLLDLIGVEHLVSDETGLPANAFMRRSLDREFRSSIASEIIEIF